MTIKNTKGHLVVLSSPSGGGKTTVRKRIVRMLDNAEYSISCTTRPARDGEVDGKDYFFVNKTTFEEMIKNNEFLEYARVFGHYYGTPKNRVKELIEKGRIVVLDIDVQGAMQIKSEIEGIFVYIVPPSMRVLKDRLVRRKTDKKETIQLRLSEAKRELSYIDQYDYAVINNTVSDTVDMVRSIIMSETCRTSSYGELLHLIKKGEI